MNTRFRIIVPVWACLAAAGCLNVRTPDVRINSEPPPERNDTARVPATHSHEEAQRELAKAYREIDYLRAENDRQRRKIDELRQEKEEYKDKYKREKDRHDD